MGVGVVLIDLSQFGKAAADGAADIVENPSRERPFARLDHCRAAVAAQW
jgi:hypothetical protein